MQASTKKRLAGEAWAQFYLSSASVEALVEQGELQVTGGTVEDAARLIGYFDKYRPAKAVLVRPHLHD